MQSVKTLISQFVFYKREQKKLFGAKPDSTADGPPDRCYLCKHSCLNRCVRARIVEVKSDSFSSIGFLDFLEDNWSTNECEELRIYFSVLFMLYGCAKMFYFLFLIQINLLSYFKNPNSVIYRNFIRNYDYHFKNSQL